MKENIDKNKKIKNNEEIEDASKYGEFISSYFAWMTLDEQKERAKELEDITEEKKQ